MRRSELGWEVAVIEPQRESAGVDRSDKKRQKQVLALPKGLVNPGEKPEQTAVREVIEETGISGEIVKKLTDIKYIYVRSWGDNQRVFKIVSFYLLQYKSGTIGDISKEMGIEVKRALWLPIEDAERLMTYRGERDVIKMARKILGSAKEEQANGKNPS